MVNLQLLDGKTSKVLEVEKNKLVLLPRLHNKGKSFLGWNIYKDTNDGFMNISADKDTTLYSVFTSGPAYILESHFRGVLEDRNDKRCHFRRYIVDVFLENVKASYGEFKIENVNHILYYFGELPIADIDTTVTHTTNWRGGAYNGVAYFTTSDITVKWQSEKPIDATKTRQKIATLMLCFGKWGMSYYEIEKRSSDEIIIPDKTFKAKADEHGALVSANFYNGLLLEEEISKENPAAVTVKAGEQLPNINFGKLLTRFAVMADSHVGIRYKWKNYDWLYGVFEHLEELHKGAPFDFVLQLGDNIDDGYAETYQTDYDIYLDVIKKLTICDPENPIENRKSGKIPHYELQGNHDTSMDIRFFCKKLWYIQNSEGKKVAFIAFSTQYGGYPAIEYSVAHNYLSYRSYGVLQDEMVEFVKNAIVEARQNGAVHIVLCNHFGISQALSAPILPETGLGKIEVLCKKYGIKLYLNGHEHNSEYTLHKYNDLYDYDASMTCDKYAVYEIYEKYAKVSIYNTVDNSLARIDVVRF